MGKEIITESLKEKIFLGLKMGFAGFLTLILLIPLAMIDTTIKERTYRKTDAEKEIENTWGYGQQLGGPLLRIPFYGYRTEIKTLGNGKKEKTVHKELHYAYFLPEDLKVHGHLDPEVRYRGIFKVPLYKVNLEVEGVFSKLDFSTWKIEKEDILWKEAKLFMGISDVRAIAEPIKVHWGDSFELDFVPGSLDRNILPSALEAPLPDLSRYSSGEEIPFSLKIVFSGSRFLAFLPLGKKTEVDLKSPWPHPSFTGFPLPQTRTITEKGFEAHWKTLYLGRHYPQNWQDQEVKSVDFERTAFGVEVFFPVDSYQKTQRSTKYGVLFILLTFLAFFLFEIFHKTKMHPIAYLLVGLALCLFYMLLLSLSEHLSFASSYLIASAATILMITLYGGKIFGKKSASFSMMLGLVGLYGYLYVLLQLQNYALLMGTLGLFVILALVMFVTSKIDWYTLGSAQKKTSDSSKKELT